MTMVIGQCRVVSHTWNIFLAGLLSIWASRERAVNLGMGSPIGSPGQWLCPNNCRIALNTLVKIQTMVVKIINTIVEISDSQMLKYAGHSGHPGGERGLTSASFRDLAQFNPFEQKRGFPRNFLSNQKLLTTES